MDRVRQYWMDGWGTVRDTSSSISVVIGDAFFPIESWNGFMSQGWNNVILDTHQYQVFSPGELSRSIDDHVGSACAIGWQLRNADKPTITGEWSGALTDCTKWLNGVGRGVRYEGTFAGEAKLGDCGPLASGSISGAKEEDKVKTRR